jgi:hypothetical protein
MIGADTTFLVQLELVELPAHEAARVLLQRDILQPQVSLALAPQVLAEFIHVVTDPRRFQKPLTADEAVDKAHLWGHPRQGCAQAARLSKPDSAARDPSALQPTTHFIFILGLALMRSIMPFELLFVLNHTIPNAMPSVMPRMPTTRFRLNSSVGTKGVAFFAKLMALMRHGMPTPLHAKQKSFQRLSAHWRNCSSSDSEME